MSEASLVGAVATALEPAAAQLLEELHADLSAEITRLEAEMPAEVDTANAAIKYWVGDAKTVLHKFIAKIDVARGGASTVGPNALPKPIGSVATATAPVATQVVNAPAAPAPAPAPTAATPADAKPSA